MRGAGCGNWDEREGGGICYRAKFDSEGFARGSSGSIPSQERTNLRQNAKAIIGRARQQEIELLARYHDGRLAQRTECVTVESEPIVDA